MVRTDFQWFVLTGDCVLRHHFSVARKAATKLSKTLRNTYFKQQCCTYSRNPKKFWKLINDLTGRSKNHPIDAFPYYCPGARRGNVFVATWLLRPRPRSTSIVLYASSTVTMLSLRGFLFCLRSLIFFWCWEDQDALSRPLFCFSLSNCKK